MSVIGNLTENAVRKQKGDGTEYLILKVAVNKSKTETKYVSAFMYGVSEKRQALMTEGSMVSLYGNYDDSVYLDKKSKEDLFSKMKSLFVVDKETGSVDFDYESMEKTILEHCSINRKISEKDFDFVFMKKRDSETQK